MNLFFMMRTILLTIAILTIVAAVYGYITRHRNDDTSPIKRVLTTTIVLLALLLGFVGYYFLTLSDNDHYNPYGQLSEK